MEKINKLACVGKLEISYRVKIIVKDFDFFGRLFFEDYMFCMVKYLSFHKFFFCLKILKKCKWQGHTM